MSKPNPVKPHSGRYKDARDARLAEAAESDDDFNIIVVGTTYCEAVTRRLLEQKLPHPDHIKWDAFGLASRVDLLLALGVLTQSSAYLVRKLNSLRNRFAHDIDAQIDEGEVDNLLSGMPTALRGHFDAAVGYEGDQYPLRAQHKNQLRAFIMLTTVLLTSSLDSHLEAAHEEAAVRQEVRQALERGQRHLERIIQKLQAQDEP